MKKLLLSSLLIFIVLFLQAQEKENADRPKIGLVLSGGGAKGTKGAGASAGSRARKVTRTAAAKISAPKREMPSTELSRPSMSIQKGPEKREFTKTESKIAGELQKMKSGENTEASRAKIKALQDKRRAEKMKAERQKDRSNNKALRKSARAAKFNARQVKKSAK